MDAGIGMVAGYPIGLAECHGVPSQQFGYDTVMKTIYLSASRLDASLCMDLAGGKIVANGRAQMWECNGLVNQQWEVKPSSPLDGLKNDTMLV